MEEAPAAPPLTSNPQSRPGGTATERPRARPHWNERGRAITAAVLLAGAIGFANLTASRLARRVDLTGDRIYTLSEASRALVRGLPDPLTVKAYFSADLPPAQAAVARYAGELLEEYRLASGGQLRYQVEDPASDPRIEEQAGRCRIGKLAIQTRHTGKLEIAQRFLGLCLWYDGRSRALAPIDPGAALEYQITALIKVMSQKRRKVAFTVGHGERDLGTEYSFVKRLLDHELDVITLDPSTAAIGDDVDLLVIAGGYGPDKLRTDEGVKALVRGLHAQGKPIAFICHAGWVPISAGIVEGRRVTSVPAIADDLRNAGAQWEDSEVVVDGNLISSRRPTDLPAFMRALIAVAVEASEPVAAS